MSVFSKTSCLRTALVKSLHNPSTFRCQFSTSLIHPAKTVPITTVKQKKFAGDLLAQDRILVSHAWVISDWFRDLGYARPDQQMRVFFMFAVHSMKDRLSAAHAVRRGTVLRYLREGCVMDFPANKELYENPVEVAKAYYTLGVFLMFPANIYRYRHLAKWALTYATEAGNYDAAIALWRLATMEKDSMIQSTALATIQAAANARLDWEAMTLYVKNLLDTPPPSTRKIREDAFSMAKDLFEMVEPGKPRAPNVTFAFPPMDQPWELLMNAADQYSFDHRANPEGPEFSAARAAFETAIREGATTYKDPKACRHLAQLSDVVPHSPLWLEMKTKSAMDGDSDDCFAVGKYWLQKQGQYPCTGKMQKDRATDRIGLDWLELSASLCPDDAQKMATRYLAAALVLRENGDSEGGFSWVHGGIEKIREDATNGYDRDQAIRKLENFASQWNSNFGSRAAQILGPPI